MTLADLRRGQQATIRLIDSADPSVLRLMELGLVEGTRLHFVNSAIGGDPLEFHLSGIHVSLRREQASKFQVVPEAL
jgi:Fe2+ transport system protein FeoA